MKPLLLSLTLLLAATSVSAQNKSNAAVADRPFIGCPITQPKVKNGDKPNPELLKKLIQCTKGEAKAPVGYDGSALVDVNSVQIGAPRKWNNRKDTGAGANGTIVYPVKASYSIKTFYRDRTKYVENTVRTFNFYVNSFGQWVSGSEVNVSAGTTRVVKK